MRYNFSHLNSAIKLSLLQFKNYIFGNLANVNNTILTFIKIVFEYITLHVGEDG